MALVALFALVQAPLSSQAPGEKKLEVFSWWTSGGEAAALDALFTVYNKQYPGVEIVNASVAGGGGFAARVTGRLNKQIAERLGISDITVKIHRRHVMRKMRADSPAELVRMVERFGMSKT